MILLLVSVKTQLNIRNLLSHKIKMHTKKQERDF